MIDQTEIPKPGAVNPRFLSTQLSFVISGKQICARCVLRTASFFCTQDYNLHTAVLRTPFLCAVVANRMVRP
jgi:hypothetical protein